MAGQVAVFCAENPWTGGSAMSDFRRREWMLSAALLATLMTTVYHDVIFRGRSLVHSNYINPFDYRPIPQNYGDSLVPHTVWADRNLWLIANFRDAGASRWQWEPSTQFLKRAIEKREWPFWDPYLAAGTPAMANLVPAFFFPPYTLVVALGAGVHLRSIYFLVLIWGAAFLTFLFLRQHGLSVIASMCGSIIVLMSGAMNQTIGSYTGQTAACLPLALYVTRLFLSSPTSKRVAALALTYASVALASYPPLLVGIFGVTALYVLVALALGDFEGASYRRAAVAVRWLGAVILSTALVGFYYAPALALRQAVLHVAAMYRGAGLETMPFLNIYQLLSPTLMGGVQVYVNAPFTSLGYGAHIPYVGVVCLACALLAWPQSGRSSRTLFVAGIVCAGLVLMKLFGIPPIQWVGYLPFFREIHFAHYLGVPLDFLMAFLAALGVEGLLRNSTSRWKVAVVAAFTVMATLSIWWIAEGQGALKLDGADYWIRDWKFLGVITALAVSSLVTLTLIRGRSVRLAAVMTLLALIAAEGIYNNSYPRPAAWDMYEHPLPYMRALRKDAGMERVFRFGTAPANSTEGFRVFMLDSLMVFNPPRVFELYQRYAVPPPQPLMSQASSLPPEPVLDRANISFVAAYNAEAEFIRQAEARGYSRRFDDGFTTLLERRAAPRFRYSSEYRVVSPASALEAIASTPPREIVLEEAPGFGRTPNSSGDPQVDVEEYGLNSVMLSVDAPRPGLVYASESFFDGWTARVNGRAARILPADYAFRAVAVPAGRNRIEFRYWPPGLTAGLVISVAAGVVVLWLALIGRARGRNGLVARIT
jgi:Bacterial membrane protein YfhO